MLQTDNRIHSRHFDGRKRTRGSRFASIRRSGYFVLGNAVIRDKELDPACKRLYVAMVAYKSSMNQLSKTLDELCDLSGIKSRTTLCASLQTLAEKGIITCEHRTYYSPAHDRAIYGANVYEVKAQDLSQGYTLVPRCLLGADLTNAAFVYALDIYALSGRKGRSWLSLRRTAARLGLSVATICRALHQFRIRQVVACVKCRKTNRAFSCNSYYPMDFVRAGFFVNGVLKNGQQPVIKKITDGVTGRKGAYSEVNVAVPAIYRWLSWQEKPCYWDGDGVRVSTVGVPDALLT